MYFAIKIFVFALLLPLGACVSGKKQVEKTRQTALRAKEKTRPPGNKTRGTIHKIRSQEVAFIEQMTKPSPRELTPSDHDMIAAIGKKLDQTSIDRAVLVLAGLRLALQKQFQALQYQQADLFKSPEQGSKEQIREIHSVATQMNSYDTDLASELEENPILQSLPVFELALAASKHDKQDYRTKIIEICANKAEAWVELNQRLSSPVDIPVADQELRLEEQNSVADIRLADLILVEAERLSERKNYPEAVSLAQSISQVNPLSKSAQDKIRKFSNLAVVDLRRKAALAFQNALPVNDLRIKQTYLNEAKSYLESAINEYPGADQLSKIKENLAVISKDLETIQDQLEEEPKD